MKQTAADIKMRAHAMRVADILSRIDISPSRKWTATSTRDGGIEGKLTRVEKTAVHPPKMKDWPEIDMDFMLPENQDSLILVDDGATPAVWPVSVGVAFDYDNQIRLGMFQSVSLKEIRGIARRVSRFNAIGASIFIDEHGRVCDWGADYFGRFDRKWSSLTLGGNFTGGCYCTGTRFDEMAPCMIGMALRQRYEWAAIFSFPSGIRLRFGCSAQGALELFRDREKGEASRRAALLHWVRRHWRRTSDPKTAKAVRQHLRGVTSFDWRGISVSVIPAEYELEQVA